MRSYAKANPASVHHAGQPQSFSVGGEGTIAVSSYPASYGDRKGVVTTGRNGKFFTSAWSSRGVNVSYGDPVWSADIHAAQQAHVVKDRQLWEGQGAAIIHEDSFAPWGQGADSASALETDYVVYSGSRPVGILGFPEESPVSPSVLAAGVFADPSGQGLVAVDYQEAPEDDYDSAMDLGDEFWLSRSNPDASLRLLERAAVSGDPRAQERYDHAMRRAGGDAPAAMVGDRFEVHEVTLGAGGSKAIKPGVWEAVSASGDWGNIRIARVLKGGRPSKAKRDQRLLSPEVAETLQRVGGNATSAEDPHLTTASERRALFDVVSAVLAPTFFRSVGLAVSVVAEALASQGFEFGSVPTAPLFDGGGSASMRLDLARKTGDPFSPVGIDDNMLVLNFHKMRSGNVEVTGGMTLANPRQNPGDTLDYLRRALADAPASQPSAPGLTGWTTRGHTICSDCAGRIMARGGSLPVPAEPVWDTPVSCELHSSAQNPGAVKSRRWEHQPHGTLGMIEGEHPGEGGWQPPAGTPRALSSKAFKAAMRKAKVTSRDVARAIDLPLKRVSEIRDRGISGAGSAYTWLGAITRASYAKHLEGGVDVTTWGFGTRGTGAMADVFKARSRVDRKGRGTHKGNLVNAYGRALSMLGQVQAEDPGNHVVLVQLRQAVSSLQRQLLQGGVDVEKLEADWQMRPGTRPLPNPLLAVVGNPPRGGDRGIREAERGAASGDPAAIIRLEVAQYRQGKPAYERIYLVDALERYGLGKVRDRAIIAKALRGFFKAKKIKGVSITTPRYSMASTIEVSGPKRKALSRASSEAISEALGLETASSGAFSVTPFAREDRTEWATDYYRPGGPSFNWPDAQLFIEHVRKAAPAQSAPAPALGFRAGQVVKFVGPRQRKRYVVMEATQYTESSPVYYTLRALSGGAPGSYASMVDGGGIELSSDQSLGDTAFADLAPSQEFSGPVSYGQVQVRALPDGRILVHPHSTKKDAVRVALFGEFGSEVMNFGGAWYVEGASEELVIEALMDAGINPDAPPPGASRSSGAWLKNAPLSNPLLAVVGNPPRKETAVYNALTGEVRRYHGMGAAGATQQAAYEDDQQRPVGTATISNHVRTGDWCGRVGALANAPKKSGEKLPIWWARLLDTVTSAMVNHSQQQGGMGVASLTRSQWIKQFAPGKSRKAQDHLWSGLFGFIRKAEANGASLLATHRPGWIDLNISNVYDAAWTANEGTIHQLGQDRERELLESRYSGPELVGRLEDRGDFWDDLDRDYDSGDPEVSEEDYRSALNEVRQGRLAAEREQGSLIPAANPHERRWDRPAEKVHSIDEFRDHQAFDEAMADLVEFHGEGYVPEQVTVYEVEDGNEEQTWAPMHSYLHELEDLTYTVPDERSNKHQGANPEDYPGSERGEPGLWNHKFHGQVNAPARAKIARPIAAKAGGAQSITIIPRGGGIADWWHS